MAERTVKIKLVSEGKDVVIREYRSIFEQIRSEAKTTSDYLKRSFASGVSAGQNNNSINDKTRIYSSTSRASADQELRRAEAELRRFQASSAQIEKQITRQVEAEAKAQSRIKIAEAKRANVEAIRELKQFEAAQRKLSQGGDVATQAFGGTFLGSLIGGGIGGLIASTIVGITGLTGALGTLGTQAVVTSTNFERTRNALTAITGSATVAGRELASLEKLASNTPGLGLETAERGFSRLRAVGFEAERARDLLAGLSKVKVLSGGTQEDLEGVLFNLTQIRSLGRLTGDELRESLGRLPALNSVIENAFGTLDTKKIAELNLTSNQFFDRFIAGLKGVQSTAGGTDDAFQKLNDEYTLAKRAFGEPILEPLTEGLRDLTQIIKDNKDEFSTFGQIAGDSLRGTISLTQDLIEVTRQYLGLQQSNDKTRDIRTAVGIANPLIGIVAEAGARGRQDARAARLAKENKDFNFGDIVGGISTKVNPEIAKAAERQKKLAAQNAKAEDDQRRKIEIERLENSSKEAVSILKNRFEVERAIRSSAIRNNTGEELGFLRTERAARRSELQSEIAERAGFYNKLIDLNVGNNDEVRKLSSEKNVALGELNKQLLLNEIETQTRISETERRILDERRKAFIDFKRLSISGTEAGRDNQAFDVSRAITQGAVSAEAGFNRLRDITKTAFEEIGRLQRESLDLQLQDLSLSDEQRANIVQQGFLEQQRLAEDNRRQLLDITDRQNAEQIARLERFRNQASTIYKTFGDLFSSAENAFLNPESFGSSTLDNLRNVLLKQSERKTATTGLSQANAEADRAKAALGNIRVGDLTPAETAAFNKASNAYAEATSAAQAYQNTLDSLTDSVPKAYFEFERLAEQISRGNVNAFDEAAAASLKYRQELERADASSEIAYLQDRIKLETDLGKKLELNFQLAQATRGQEKLLIEQNIASVNLYQNSLEGLSKRLQALRNGDVSTVTGVRRTAQEVIKREQISTAEQIIELQERINQSGAGDGDRVRLAYLQDILDLRNRELDAVISINRSQLELASSTELSANQVRARVLEHLASQKTLSDSLADGIISAFDKAVNFLDKRLGKIGDIPIIGDLLKFSNRNLLSGITESLTGLFPGLSGILPDANKTGNPQVDAINKSNDYLKSIDSKLGGIGGIGQIGGGLSTPSGAGGGILGLIKKLFGGGSGGAGAYRTPSFNPNALNFFGGGGGDFSGGNPLAGLSEQFGFGGSTGSFSGGQPRGALGSFNLGIGGLGGGTRQGNILQRIIGQGGIFGKQGFGANVGTFGTIGTGVGILGNLLGGIPGRTVSGAGLGLSLGASIGSIVPGLGTVLGAGIGAAIGAIGGLISGIFSRNSRRRQEERLRTQYLQEAVAGLSQFDELIRGVRTHRIDPESAITQGTSLGQQLRTQYLQQASSLKDKKTRDIAVRSVSELNFKIDQKMNELRAVSEKAGSDIDRRNRILPEFASGGFMDAAFAKQFSEFKKRNGVLPGTFTGRDTLPAMLAEGEMVLNPEQQRRIIEAARHDIFRNKGIPGYATGTFIAPTIQPSVQTPVYQNQGVTAQTVETTVVIENLTLQVNSLIGTEDAATIYDVGASTEAGQRVLVRNLKVVRGKNKI